MPNALDPQAIIDHQGGEPLDDKTVATYRCLLDTDYSTIDTDTETTRCCGAQASIGDGGWYCKKCYFPVDYDLSHEITQLIKQYPALADLDTTG